jgi:hypothetical protein
MQDRTYSTIPSDDEEFRTTVAKLADEAGDVDRLRELIGSLYPDAHVSIQDALGSLPGQPMRVYIYRDGNGIREES